MSFGTEARQPDGTPGSDDWRTLSEELLQGLVHALNNRVAALSAFVELVKLGDEGGDPIMALPAEIAQLSGLSALFGMLPERKSEPEALELQAVLDDAIRLHAHHPMLRGERVIVTFEGTPAVVRAPRWALVRALVMLVHAARRAVDSVPGGVGTTVHVLGDDSMVRVRVAAAEDPWADLVAFGEQCNGSVTREQDDLVLRMPSLRELRRLDREGRGESPPN